MALGPRPAFALSKNLIHDCKPMPADVVEDAYGIVTHCTPTAQRETEEVLHPVEFSTLARVLAFDARQDEDRQTDAYLDDEAVTRFLDAVCKELNRKARWEQVLADVVDVEASPVRGVWFQPQWWADLAQAFVKRNRNTSEDGKIAEKFWKNLRRQNVLSSDAFLDLDVVFFPRCAKKHWILNVVCPRKRVFATLNSAAGSIKYTGFVSLFVRPFLQALLGPLYQAGDWREASDAAGPIQAAQQTNPTDCGALLCMSAVAIATNKAPSGVDIQRMKHIREAIAGTLVLGSFVEGRWEL